MNSEKVEYAGFWVRVGASLIDTVLLLAVIVPLLVAIYGWAYFLGKGAGAGGPADLLINWVLPAVVIVGFWLKAQATPGKMVLSCRVVDARSGGALSPGQAIGRYLGYFVSLIPLGLGLIWVAFDARKQGWHDKLAGTLVIRSSNKGVEPAKSAPP